MKTEAIIWKDKSGKIISCPQKLDILQENLEEILHVYMQAKEDAILFGVSFENFKENILGALKNC